MIRLFIVFLTALLSSFAISANEDVVKGAMGFILGGDSGWSGAGVRDEKEYVTIEGCFVGYVVDHNGVPLTHRLELDRVNWKSATLEDRADGTWFTVSGDEDLLDIDIDGVTAAQKSRFAYLYGIPFLGAKSELSVKLTVTEGRFENALNDLQSECPGKSSKY